MKKIMVLGVGERSHGRPWVPRINSPMLSLPYRVAWVWDPDPQVAADMAQENHAEAVDQPADVIDEVDGGMVTTTDPATYLDDARLFLERGVPVFLNRPMGASPAMAREILAVAVACEAPVASGSSLYYSPYIHAVRAHAEQLGRLRAFCASTVASALYMYLPHAIAVMQSVLGPEVEWVHAFGRWDLDSVPDDPINVLAHVQYAPDARFGPVQGTIQYMKGGHAGGYTLKLWGEKGLTPTINFGDCDLYGNILRALGPFFVQQREPMTHAHMLAAVDIYYAIVTSLREDRRVTLAEMHQT